MAKRKKQKRGGKKSFKLTTTRRRKPHKVKKKLNLLTILKVAGATFFVGAVVIGLVYLEKDIVITDKRPRLELALVPVWVNKTLQEKVYVICDNYPDIDKQTAAAIQQDIEGSFYWLAEPKVHVTHDKIRIEGDWRKPLALIKYGVRKFFLDANMVVLEFVDELDLPIVKIEGYEVTANLLEPGQARQDADITAAIEIIALLDRRDKDVTPAKPLLYEIDRINVSNFNGRQSTKASHIILYTTDNTEIAWGARIGDWPQHLESTDEEKLAKLYGYYEQFGSLLDGARYINLCDPQQTIPLPVDKD